MEENCKAAREVIATQLTKMANAIADRAEKTEAETKMRLEPVQMQCLEPTLTGKNPEVPAPAWPPLFTELRACLWRVERSLKSISDNINRVEF